LGREDLIAAKERAGRFEDLADLRKLKLLDGGTKQPESDAEEGGCGG
jgi:hypothetical protein